MFVIYKRVLTRQPPCELKMSPNCEEVCACHWNWKKGHSRPYVLLLIIILFNDMHSGGG